jgi:hypothetical protein
MLRIVEHVTVYSAVAATIWWHLYIEAEARIGLIVAALATALLAGLLVNEMEQIHRANEERREAERGHQAAVEAERLRRSAYDLCAGLRLGFDICENCWTCQPDKAARELDRLRAAVGQFVAIELGTPASH